MTKAKKYLAALTVSLTLLAGFGLFTSPLFAKNATPESSTLAWNVSGKAESVYEVRSKAIVYDLQEHNGKMYVGGKFLNIVDPDGNELASANGDAPAFLAAFDLTTGAWDKTFFPKLDGPVYALDVRSDGKIIAGGEFDGGVAALDPVTGATEATFKPALTRENKRPGVFDVEVVGNQIYVGGAFTKSANLRLRRLARLDAQTGAVDPTWTPKTMFDEVTPSAAGELVYSIAVDSARDRVYVTGKFGGINGDTNAAYFATLDTKGNLRQDVRQGLPLGIVNHRQGWSMWQHDVQFFGEKVYLGGQGHQTVVMDAATLTAETAYTTHRGLGDTNNGGGDTQVIFVGQNTIWSGCHCWDSVGPYEIGGQYNQQDKEDGSQPIEEYRRHIADFGTVEQQKVRGIYGIDKATNELLPNQFNISGDAGPWALYEDSYGQLWGGGQFRPTKANHPENVGLVRFGSQPSATPETPTPTTMPETETTVTETTVTETTTGKEDAAALPPTNPTPPVNTTVPADPPQTTATPATTPATPETPDTTTRQERSTHACAAPAPKQYGLDDDTAAQIYRLYCAYFDRHPDAQGFADWQNRHKNGYSMKRISAHFEDSNENKPNHVNVSNADFVASLYENVLMREDTTSIGYQKWVAALDNGMPRSELMINFSNSKEFRNLTGTK